MKPQPDALYLFLCHLEWRHAQNSEAHKELMAALGDQDADIRNFTESLLEGSGTGSPRLEINIRENEGSTLVCLSGYIEIDSSPALRDQLLTLLANRHMKRVNINLSAVKKIDSSGIATLIEALKVAHAGKTELRLQGLHDELLRVFEFTGLVSLFNGSGATMIQSACEVVR